MKYKLLNKKRESCYKFEKIVNTLIYKLEIGGNSK